ncbi:MAG: flagellar motor switch protein FliN [Pseudomonadota bacterium]|nr:flagellar motor switch protein FliN [Pseudomonadota bacterium]
MAETEAEELVEENQEESKAEDAPEEEVAEAGEVGEAGESESADENGSDSGKINSDVLQNIPVTISVEVGRTSLKIRDLMRLTQGSVVELDRIAGEPLDLLVNDTLVAQGEIVLVNERYGVRLTQVIPAADRVKNL